MLGAFGLLALLQGVAPTSADPVPLTQPSTWIAPHDYSQGVQGRTVALLQVDVQGKVTSCAIRTSSGSDILDRTVCKRATERARFSPARDLQGMAVPGSYVLPVLWGTPSIDIEPRRTRRVLTMKDGQAIRCANYDTNGLLVGAESNVCHTPTALLVRYFGNEYKAADKLIIDSFIMAGDGLIPRAAAEGRRITLKESVVTIGDDGAPQTCTSRVGTSDQNTSLQDCVGYEAGLPFIGLKRFVSAIDWTVRYPTKSDDTSLIK